MSAKEVFKKYLEETGIMSKLIHSLAELYEERARTEDAVKYLIEKLIVSNGGETIESLQQKILALEHEIQDLKKVSVENPPFCENAEGEDKAVEETEPQNNEAVQATKEEEEVNQPAEQLQQDLESNDQNVALTAAKPVVVNTTLIDEIKTIDAQEGNNVKSEDEDTVLKAFTSDEIELIASQLNVSDDLEESSIIYPETVTFDDQKVTSFEEAVRMVENAEIEISCKTSFKEETASLQPSVIEDAPQVKEAPNHSEKDLIDKAFVSDEETIEGEQIDNADEDAEGESGLDDEPCIDNYIAANTPAEVISIKENDLKQKSEDVKETLEQENDENLPGSPVLEPLIEKKKTYETQEE